MRRPAWLGRRLDPDATLALRPRQHRQSWPLIGLSAIAASAAILAVAGIWLTLRAPAPQAGAAPALADEAALLAAPTDHFTLWRFRAAPGILVAIFPSLHAQALALNRVAAFVEKQGAPRDHVLDDGALSAAIGGSGENFDSYYYGHDYRAADLARFYATAAQDGVALRPAERSLRAALTAAGLFSGDLSGAVITLPPRGTGLLDESGRLAILDHELAHGAYFTDPAYAAYVQGFWRRLSDGERTAFRRFLGGEGYDTANEDLMRNETQAYLVFTGDPRMFDPARLGLPEAATLRDQFERGITAPWLRQDAISH